MCHLQLHLEIPKVPFTCIAIDTIGKLPTTSSGNKYAQTCIDLLTSYIIAVPMPDKTAESIIKVYLSGILSRASASMVCLSDNGSELKNSQTNTILKVLGINCTYSNPYRPQGNSRIENIHNLLKRTFTNLEEQLYSLEQYIASVPENTTVLQDSTNSMRNLHQYLLSFFPVWMPNGTKFCLLLVTASTLHQHQMIWKVCSS